MNYFGRGGEPREVRFEGRRRGEIPRGMLHLEVKELLGRSASLSVFYMYVAMMGKKADFEEDRDSDIIYLGRFGRIHGGRRSSPTSVARIGAIQKGSNNDRGELIEIEAGSEESLVEVYGGYKVEFISPRRSELAGCTQFKRYGPGSPDKIRNSELVDRDINGDIECLVYLYCQNRGIRMIGSEAEVGEGRSCQELIEFQL